MDSGSEDNSRIMARKKKKERKVEGIWGQGWVTPALSVSTDAKHTHPMTQQSTPRPQPKHHQKKNEQINYGIFIQ